MWLLSKCEECRSRVRALFQTVGGARRRYVCRACFDQHDYAEFMNKTAELVYAEVEL